MVYLNPGMQSFSRIVTSKTRKYVDKTGMIALLNRMIDSNEYYVVVSRPRRFGKSTAASMLCAYYDCSVNSEDLFHGLSISKNPEEFHRYLNQFRVFSINMLKVLQGRTVSDAVRHLEKMMIQDILKQYPDVVVAEDERIFEVLTDVYQTYSVRFVLVLDEWDAPLRFHAKDETGYAVYISFLDALLKDQSYLALAYLTGILPIKKYGDNSLFNMRKEISMLDTSDFAEYTGFTDSEVKALCAAEQIDYDFMRTWYDGYEMTKKQTEIISGNENGEKKYGRCLKPFVFTTRNR